MRRAGIAPGNDTVLMVSTADCRSNCGNPRVRSGMCYCDPDENGRCPGNERLVTDWLGNPACLGTPTTARVIDSVTGDMQVIQP